MSLNCKDKDILVTLTSELITIQSELCRAKIESYLVRETLAATEVVDEVRYLIMREWSKCTTEYKRTKEIRNDKHYVSATKKAIGIRWEKKLDQDSMKTKLVQLQSICEYVSIIDTIKSLFLRKEFMDMFFEGEHKHNCEPGVYKDVCCARLYQNSEFYKNNINALQIQLLTDDFEICSPLQSKAGIHKVCAYYFRILNLPKKYLSRINNIYLIALCNVKDIKSGEEGHNKLLEIIVSEIKSLEENGIYVGPNSEILLKGSIINLCSDNLGFNTAFGLVESFNATYFCRFCIASNKECKTLTKEIESKLRTVRNHRINLEHICKDEANYIKSSGLKHECKLNELQNFHICTNIAADIMHDINEGLIPFILKKLFTFVIDNKILTAEQLCDRICYYDYGKLNKSNVPSNLSSEKKNLGLNASQLYCLIIHTPFILYKFKEKLSSSIVWISMELLRQIMQIIYSSNILEGHVIELESLITKYLENIKLISITGLTPKHHNLTHYPTIIRNMGPLTNMSMMRAESKHRYFTKIAHKTNNFININYTMTSRHQKDLICNGYGYDSIIEPGKKKLLIECDYLMEKYSHILNNVIQENVPIWIFNSIRINGYTYKPKLFIKISLTLYEIECILFSNNNYWIASNNSYRTKEFNHFLHSVELEKNEILTPEIFNFSDLENKQTYEMVRINHRSFIVVENLDFPLPLANN